MISTNLQQAMQRLSNETDTHNGRDSLRCALQQRRLFCTAPASALWTLAAARRTLSSSLARGTSCRSCNAWLRKRYRGSQPNSLIAWWTLPERRHRCVAVPDRYGAWRRPPHAARARLLYGLGTGASRSETHRTATSRPRPDCGTLQKLVRSPSSNPPLLPILLDSVLGKGENLVLC